MLDLLKFSITAKNNTGNAFSGVKKELGGVKGMLAGVQDRANRVGKSMRNIGAGMSLGVTAPIAAMGKQMVNLYDTQVQSEAAVGAAIKSTGGAAGKTLDDLKGLASGLQEITTFGDEDILRNVTAPLLTFTKVQGEVFDRAQGNVLDMATLLKMDLRSASVLVGKALNDPIKGVTALSRSGVQFTENQKGMIKSLVETGDVAAAQTLILKELETQFKGQASAAANAPLGQWKQLSNLVGDVKEQLGEQIIPFLKPVVVQAKAAVTWFGNLSPEVKRNIVVIGGLAAAVGPLVAGLGLMVMGVTAVGGAFATMGALLLANPLFLAIAAVAGGAYLIYRNWDSISAWFSGVWEKVKSAFNWGWDSIKNLLLNYTAPGLIYKHWDGIGQWFSDRWDDVRSATSVGWDLVKNLLLNYTPYGLIYQHWDGVAEWFSAQDGDMRGAFLNIWEGIKAEISLWPGRMLQAGKDMIASLISGLKGGDVQGALKQAHTDALATMPNNGLGLGIPLGRDISTGLALGVLNGKSEVGGAGDEIMNYLTSTAKDTVDSNSPSRVFMGIGKDVVDGLAIGLQDNAKTAIGGMVELGRGLIVEAENNISIIGSFRDGAKSIFTSVLTRAQTFKGALSGILGSIGSNLMNTGASSLFDAIWPFAKGGAFSGGNVVPFAKGGVVNSPTLFGMSGGTGLMGEAGPEAIMPLSRGSDGSLGVRAQYRDRGTKAQSEQHFKFTIVMDPSTAALGGFITDTAGEMIARAEPLTIQKSLGAVDRRMSQTRTFGSAP